MNYFSRLSTALLLSCSLGASAQKIVTFAYNNAGPVVVDSSGNVYCADGGNQIIRLFERSGMASIFAGRLDVPWFWGDGGLAIDAELLEPQWMALDRTGNLYFADAGNNRIRKINTAGIISTVAGNGNYGYSGDGGPATAAAIGSVSGMTVDATGNIYIGAHFTIRKVDTFGIISTIAGIPDSSGYSGHDTVAANTLIGTPAGLVTDAAGNLYFSDLDHYVIRQISGAGKITTIGGNGVSGYDGDSGPATSAKMTPNGLILDSAGNLYFADPPANRVRKIDASGIVTTIAGTGVAGNSPDGVAAIDAELNEPANLAIDRSGNIYICEWGNHDVREIVPIPASIFAISNSPSVAVAPNPNKGRFTIKGDLAADKGTITISNISGSVFYYEPFTTYKGRIEAEVLLHLASGIYLATITGATSAKVITFIVE